MTARSLPAALQAGAQGLYALEAAVGLLIAHGTWLARDDFRDHVFHGTGTAAIDWEAVTQAPALASPPLAGNAGCCSSQPAWPARHRSSSAMSSPGLTTATSRYSSPPSSMPPDDVSSPVRDREAAAGCQ
jgi:hypothetical protein